MTYQEAIEYIAELEREKELLEEEISTLQDDLDNASERESDARQDGYDEALENAKNAIENLM